MQVLWLILGFGFEPSSDLGQIMENILRRKICFPRWLFHHHHHRGLSFGDLRCDFPLSLNLRRQVLCETITAVLPIIYYLVYFVVLSFIPSQFLLILQSYNLTAAIIR